jgi:hypothetical protein
MIISVNYQIIIVAIMIEKGKIHQLKLLVSYFLSNEDNQGIKNWIEIQI